MIAAAEEQEQALLDKNLTLRKRVEKESEETKKVQERLLEQQRTYERHLRSVEDAEEHASGRSEAEQVRSTALVRAGVCTLWLACAWCA